MMFLTTLAAMADVPPPGGPSAPLAPLAMFQPAKPVAPGTPARSKPSREQVMAAVEAEWPRYDTRHAGRLGPLEFSSWVMRANGVAMAPAGVKTASGIKPVTAMNATARAFAAADANHDGGVTPEEMASFLLR